MKSTFFKSAALAAALFASIGAAQAQQFGAASQIVMSPTKTVDMAHARFVSTQPGNQYIIDRLGVKHVGTFRNIEAVTYSSAFREYTKFSQDLYINLSSTNSVDCVGNNSVITWALGDQQIVADGCAFSYNVRALSR